MHDSGYPRGHARRRSSPKCTENEARIEVSNQSDYKLAKHIKANAYIFHLLVHMADLEPDVNRCQRVRRTSQNPIEALKCRVSEYQSLNSKDQILYYQ